MISIGLFVLLAGLVLGVFAMLYGTERRVQPAVAPHERRSEHDPAAEPSPLFNLASLAAFTVGFGLTAYLVARYSDWSLVAQVVAAGATGGLVMSLQSVLIARWAIPSARRDQPDARYLLQGTIGRVVAAIPLHGRGAMTYTLDGRDHTLPVQLVDGGALAIDTDVVIDRVEDGVAFVEPWAVVERRL